MLKKIDDVISDVDPRPALLVSSFISSIFDLSCCILFQKENPYIGQYLLKKKQWPGRVRVPIKKGGGGYIAHFFKYHCTGKFYLPHLSPQKPRWNFLQTLKTICRMLAANLYGRRTPWCRNVYTSTPSFLAEVCYFFI